MRLLWNLFGLERLFHRPAFPESGVESYCLYTNMSRPVREGSCVRSIGNKPRRFLNVSTISRLFFLCRPTTVCRAVWSVVVNSIERCASWAGFHVSIKGGKRLSPSFANVNTSSAIVLVAGMVWVSASLDHFRPYSIFRRSLPSVQGRIRQTATRENMWESLQSLSTSNEGTSAVANAKPFHPPYTWGGRDFHDWRNNDGTATYFSGVVSGILREWYNFVRHFGTSNIELARWARAFTPRLPTIIPAFIGVSRMPHKDETDWEMVGFFVGLVGMAFCIAFAQIQGYWR